MESNGYSSGCEEGSSSDSEGGRIALLEITSGSSLGGAKWMDSRSVSSSSGRFSGFLVDVTSGEPSCFSGSFGGLEGSAIVDWRDWVGESLWLPFLEDGSSVSSALLLARTT